MPILNQNGHGRKDQLLETCPKVAVRQTYHLQRLSGLTAANRKFRNPNISSLHNVIQNRQGGEPRCKLDLSSNDLACRAKARGIAPAFAQGLQRGSLPSFNERRLVEPDGIEPTTPCLQSRCSPS